MSVWGFLMNYPFSLELVESYRSVSYPFYVCSSLSEMFLFLLRKFLLRKFGVFFSLVCFWCVILSFIRHFGIQFAATICVWDVYLIFGTFVFSKLFSQLFTTLSKLYCFVCSTYLHALFIHVTEHFRFRFSFFILLSSDYFSSNKFEKLRMNRFRSIF